MIVKVIIQREIIEGKESEVLRLVKQMRIEAMDQQGYISGETLVNAEYPLELIVISNWETLEAWSAWKSSAKRAELDAQLQKLQQKPTRNRPYVLSKYWLTVKEEGWKKRKEGVW